MGFFDRFWRSARKGAPAGDVAAQTALAEEQGVERVERRGAKRRNARHGTRVLIVDDSATVLTALRRILRSAGYATQECVDAETALQQVDQAKPDLIFLDIVLPGMNGFGALRALRRNPATAEIPVIMISGNEHATEQFYANRIGSDGFMKKPFSRFEVFAHIESLLDEHRVPRRRDALRPSVAQPPAAVPVAAAEVAPDAAQAPLWNLLDARRQLTAMGFQYYSVEQFCAAVDRCDLVAVDLFMAGGGVCVDTPVDGRSALNRAQARQNAELNTLLQRRPGAPPAFR